MLPQGLLQKPWFRNLATGLIVLFILFFFYGIRQVLSPLFIALALAYVLDPVIDKFEEWKIGRSTGIAILSLLILLVMVGLSLYLVPKLYTQVKSLGTFVEVKWDELEKNPKIGEFIKDHEEDIKELSEKGKVWLEENAGVLARSISLGVAASFKSIGAFIGNLVGLIIIPVLAFYLLRDYDIMVARIRDLIPIHRRPFVVGLFKELDQALSNFIKGQLLVALILSIIYSIGLMVAGCPAYLLIGIIAGFANLIPYLGIALGFVPAVLLTYLSGNPTWQIILAGSTFVIGQMLEGMLITPKVVGESIGLHPVVVMIGLMVGGTYFGFVGMILALPGTAVLMVIVRRLNRYYLGSVLYHDGQHTPWSTDIEGHKSDESPKQQPEANATVATTKQEPVKKTPTNIPKKKPSTKRRRRHKK